MIGKSGLLGRHVGTHDTGNRIAIGKAERAMTKPAGSDCNFLGMGGPFQKRKVGSR
jgi:hypothetical protein